MRERLQALEFRDGIADDLRHRHLFIHEAIHERGVGTVLQKTPHQICQQILVFTDRGIYPHPWKVGDVARRFRIQQPTHAMQALKLKIRLRRRQLQHGSNAVGVVGGELRIDHLRVLEQSADASQIRHIGGELACVHRVAGETAFLRAFDLGIPIRTLHQAHRHFSAAAARCCRHPINHVQGTLAVGLHREPQTRPIPGGRVLRQRLDDVQREVEAVRLLRIDGELNAQPGGLTRKVEHLRHEAVHDALSLQQKIARLQGRQLDGDARHFVHGPSRRRRADDLDRVLVGFEVARCILQRSCTLAQHVEGA